MHNKLDQLNQQFGIQGQLHFELENGFIMITIVNQHAQAKISTYAGQVLSYTPHGEPNDLIFLSGKANYQQGKAIRGGIPICWPWFANDVSGAGLPAHGFARNQDWQVLTTSIQDDGSTLVTLGLSETKESLSVWPYEFKLQLEISVGLDLGVMLTTINASEQLFTITQSLHAYFNVSDIKKVAITGLDAIEYIDKVDDFSHQHQTGDVTISQQTDQIFQNVPDTILLNDTGFNRNITVSSTGSKTTVIWNPWADGIANISDLNDDSYQNFVCVETANTADDTVTIAAGDKHTITAVYSIERLN